MLDDRHTVWWSGGKDVTSCRYLVQYDLHNTPSKAIWPLLAVPSYHCRKIQLASALLKYLPSFDSERMSLPLHATICNVIQDALLCMFLPTHCIVLFFLQTNIWWLSEGGQPVQTMANIPCMAPLLRPVHSHAECWWAIPTWLTLPTDSASAQVRTNLKMKWLISLCHDWIAQFNMASWLEGGIQPILLPIGSACKLMWMMIMEALLEHFLCTWMMIMEALLEHFLYCSPWQGMGVSWETLQTNLVSLHVLLLLVGQSCGTMNPCPTCTVYRNF